MSYNEQNFSERLLCVLLLDVSGTMDDNTNNPPIQRLNEGLRRFKNDLTSNIQTADHAEIAIVTFGDAANVIQQPDLINNIHMPTLKAYGMTEMVEGIKKAISVVEQQKKKLHDRGIPYKRPWIVMMTDGEPFSNKGEDTPDVIERLGNRIREDMRNKHYVFQTIGVGDKVKYDILRKLSLISSDPIWNYPPQSMEMTKFSEFFEWLSNSMSTAIVAENDFPVFNWEEFKKAMTE